jgi:glutathione synthase/RimK-type ligase-like ATP-grasp enzyme
VAFPVWDDPSVDWDGFDLVVVRCTWDYPERRDAFVDWARRVPRLANPAEVIAWNTDKRYLAEMAADGLPVVPTAFVAPGEPLAAPPADELVVKPSVSAGARATARYLASERDAIAAHVRRLHAEGRTAMVQPYLGAVDEAGETALLYLGGELSHAIRKGPLLERGKGEPDGLFAEEDIRPRDPSPAELALGERALAAMTARFGALLYARVDLLPSPDGPVIVEVELTEPSLFLGHAEGAPARLAEAIARAVGR